MSKLIKNSQFISLLWLVPLIFLLIFYFFPLSRILVESFARSENGVLEPFIEVITSPYIRKVIGFTFWQAFLSTFITLIVGLPGAYLLARFKFRGKSILRALTGIAFVMPTLVVATAFNSLIGPSGWINQALMEVFNLSTPPLNLTNTFIIIIIAHVFYNTTIVLRMVGDFWSRLDPRLEQASRTLGANIGQSIRHVTLPILLPAIAAAALLVFIFNFTSFGVILILGGPKYATIEVEIYYQTISLFNLPLAAALSVIQLFCTLGLTIFYTRLVARFTQPLSLKSRLITEKRLFTKRSQVLASVAIVSLLIFFTIPLVSLAVRSITRLEPDRGQQVSNSKGLTFEFYQELSADKRTSYFYVTPARAISTSLGYAAATVILTMVIGVPTSFALTNKSTYSLNRFMDPILMLPLGTSAVTLGLGFIIALNQPPLDLRTSLLLIPIAHTLVAFPFFVRSLSPALSSIQPRLRQSAALLGASPVQVFRTIDLPLIGRALLVATIFAFTISFGEFGATALISRPEYPTIPIMIYRFISQPGGLNYGQALSLSTILMIITAAGMLVIERFRVADVGEF
jgi:thiamine transport system permease protein